VLELSAAPTRARVGPPRDWKSVMTVARPPVVSQTEWDAALSAMTEREQTVAAAMHELAAARRQMPMVRVEHDYRFEGPDGRRSLPELFDGRSELILYRFFFEEGVAPDAGCAGCSSVADGIPDLGLLHARDITFAMASPAPQANLRRYSERMGWTDLPWYTICTEPFSADFGVNEWFGLNIFLRDGRTRPRAGRRRRSRSGTAVTTSSTSRRRQPAAAATRTIDPSGCGQKPFGTTASIGASASTPPSAWASALVG
jgi:Bacterial protein of unknown function (DUF899)